MTTSLYSIEYDELLDRLCEGYYSDYEGDDDHHLVYDDGR